MAPHHSEHKERLLRQGCSDFAGWEGGEGTLQASAPQAALGAWVSTQLTPATTHRIDASPAGRGEWLVARVWVDNCGVPLPCRAVNAVSLHKSPLRALRVPAL